MDVKKTMCEKGRFRVGIWVAIAITLLIAGRHVWAWVHYPYQIKNLAKAMSSIYIIQKPIVVNHAEDLAAVIHTTEKGVGVFIGDIFGKSELKVCEALDVDYKATGAWVFDWSPDDRVFAYSWDRTLHFVNNKGEEDGRVEGITNHFQSFAWLSSNCCAYIDDLPQIVVVEKGVTGWGIARSWKKQKTNGFPRSIETMDTNMVAFHTDSLLWSMNIISGECSPIYAAVTNRIEGISYSRENDSFLLTESASKRRIFSLAILSDYKNEATKKPLVQKKSVLGATWVNNGRGYAYFSNVKPNNTVLMGKDQIDHLEKMFFRSGEVRNIFGSGKNANVYAAGTQNASEPVGLWKCSLDSGKFENVLSPFSGAKDFIYQPVLAGGVKNEDGHYESFELVPPAHFSRQKKYPLVIGLGGYEWTPIAHSVYAQCLANCGAYVAFVNYRWNQSDPETVLAHTNNFLSVFNQLAANPNIDTNRVYLFGFSAGTAVLSELAKQFPGRWRGLMFLNPSQLPTVQKGMAEKVLMTAGSGENEEKRFAQYQLELAKNGIPAEWHIHENAQHVPRNQAAMYERTLWMADMVFSK